MTDIIAFELEKVAELLTSSQCETFTLVKEKDTIVLADIDETMTVNAWNPERIISDSFDFELPRTWLQAIYNKTVDLRGWEFKLVVKNDMLTHPFPAIWDDEGKPRHPRKTQ